LVAALCFLAARRTAPAWAALAAPACLLSSGPLLIYFPSCLAHASAAVLALGALAFAAGGQQDIWRRRDALAVGILLGLLLLTRQLSAIAAALVVAPSLLRSRDWKILACVAVPIALALAAATATNLMVTGEAMLSPWRLWAQQYAPFDGPGLGTATAASPLRPLPPHFEFVIDRYRSTRSAYTWSALPGEALDRLGILGSLLPSPQVLLLALAGVGELRSAGPARRIIAYGVLLFLLQLGFHATLVQYFVELAPMLAVLAAAGLVRLARLWRDGPPRAQAAAVGAACALELARPEWFVGGHALAVFALLFVGASAVLAATRRWPAPATQALLAVAACAALAADIPKLGSGYRLYLKALRADWAGLAAFDRALQPLRDRPALVLVRYRPPVGLHLPVANPRLWRGEPGLVVAVDREPYSSALVERLPGHAAFVWDAADLTLIPRAPTPAR
jgi:hypothetical protein